MPFTTFVPRNIVYITEQSMFIDEEVLFYINNLIQTAMMTTVL